MIRLFRSPFFQIFLFVLFWSCEQNEQVNSPVKTKLETQRVEFDENFKVELPTYFEEMFDINPKATLQYGFISRGDSLSADFEDEIYITIMVLPKDELMKTFADSGRITLDKVNDRTAINLDLILDDFKIGIEEPKTEIINGFSAVKNEFSGRLGTYEVFYKMAIYESENKFYQLLTWCMDKYRAKHNNEMNEMIGSFENIK